MFRLSVKNTINLLSDDILPNQTLFNRIHTQLIKFLQYIIEDKIIKKTKKYVILTTCYFKTGLLHEKANNTTGCLESVQHSRAMFVFRPIISNCFSCSVVSHYLSVVNLSSIFFDVLILCTERFGISIRASFQNVFYYFQFYFLIPEFRDNTQTVRSPTNCVWFYDPKLVFCMQIFHNALHYAVSRLHTIRTAVPKMCCIFLFSEITSLQKNILGKVYRNL